MSGICFGRLLYAMLKFWQILYLLVWVKARVGMVRSLASPFCIYAIPVSFVDTGSRSFQGPGFKTERRTLFFRLPRCFLSLAFIILCFVGILVPRMDPMFYLSPDKATRGVKVMLAVVRSLFFFLIACCRILHSG